MTSKSKYVKMSHIDHIKEIPDTYVGSIENTEEEMYLFTENNTIEKKNINYIPALYKLVDEILVNARDNICNDKTCNQIDVECNIEEGYICVKNNGDIGIPIEKQEGSDVLIPSMIFGELLTSSNYNKNEERTTGGRNGYGTKCVSADSRLFLFNGDYCLAKDIKVGDKILGDNGTVRNVLKVIKGNSQMYEISQAYGESYKVNNNHTLTLHMPDHKVIFWNSSKQGWTMLWWDLVSLSIKTKTIKVSNATKNQIVCQECNEILASNLNRHYRRKHPNIEIPKKERKLPTKNPDKTMENDNAKKELEIFAETITESGIFDINIQDYLKLSDTTKKRLAGVRGKCFEWDKRDVELDPYILGLWLGDGHKNGYGYSCNDPKDPEIIDYLNKWCEKNDADIIKTRDYTYKIVYIDKENGISPLKKLLKKYNLIESKHIPKEYLVNDRDTRLKVLAGIIDTDGTVEREGTRVVITQGLNHEQLINDIVYLARTLGFACSLTMKNTTWKHNDLLKTGQAYNINISGNIEDIPTLLPRKKCHSSKQNNMSLTTGQITVREIEETEYIGITVDDNHRFVINDFTVTHNCVNIFSTRFIIEIYDFTRKKHLIQEWTNNMSNTTGPIVTKAKEKSSVKVKFYPDFERFKINGLNEDYLRLIYRRTIDIAGTSEGKLKITYNNEKINISNFKSYIELYYKDETIYFDSNERWSVGVIYKRESNNEVISFVNGINTYRGGTHCNYVIDTIIKILINDYIKKKDKDIKINASTLKDNLVFFINSVIINPSFSSQTKDTLNTKADKFGSKYEPSATFLKKLAKCGIVEHVIDLAKTKESASLKKTDGKKQIRISGIPKLEDANKAGTKESKNCTLILTEGDSAKTTAMAGLSNLGRDYYGVFPLKGKLLNVREATNVQLLNNEEIKNLKTIIGLKQGEDYTIDDKFNTLRYGHIIVFVDSDYDGSHIKGLFMNLIHSLWPSLIKRENFIQGLATPIIKAFHKTKKDNKLNFYTILDYDNWKNDTNNNIDKYNIKYYKGLGTSTASEAKEYFENIDNKIINYKYENQNNGIIINEDKEDTINESDSESIASDDNSDNDREQEQDNYVPIHDDDDALKLAFVKNRANERKKWLMNFNKDNIIKYEQKSISFYDFIHYEFIHFSNEDIYRSIPHIIDGFKPSQRKVLYGCFKADLDRDEKKVSQLAGIVSDISQYHHGEMSLNGTIIGMAQNYVGSNNINILEPNGQFGSRYSNGKDHASSRYIWTKLSPMATLIYKKVDNPLLNQLYDDGLPIEPEYYVPIIPMILVNGTEGIGTGFSTKIPPYNPINIIDNLLNMINNKELIDMDPWWQSFDGSVVKINENSYEIKGKYEIKGNKLIITELPIGESTYNYKEFLEKILSGIPSQTKNTKKTKEPKKESKKENNLVCKKENNLISYSDNNTDTKIYFELLFEENYLDENINNIEKIYKLSKKYSITNMHLYSPKGNIKKYLNVKDIIKDYYDVRLDFYNRRKEYQLNILKNELENISHKVKFIFMVINNELIVNNTKKNIIEIELEKHKFPKTGHNISYDYLLSMPIYNLTYEKIEELKKLEEKKQTEYDELDKLEPKTIWKLELNELKEKYNKWYEEKLLIDNNQKTISKKKSKKN